MNGLTIVSTNISSNEDRYYSYGDFYSAVVSAIVNMGIEKAHIIEMSDFYAHDKTELFRILSNNLNNYYNPNNVDYQDVFIIVSANISESMLAMYKLDLDINTDDESENVKLAMEILDRSATVLKDLGFVMIESLEIENTIPFVFPNKSGVELIEYLERTEEDAE